MAIDTLTTYLNNQYVVHMSSSSIPFVLQGVLALIMLLVFINSRKFSRNH
jgi:hypothetical protein